VTLAGYTIRKVSDNDKDAIVGITNHFIENGYANYMESKVGDWFFDMARNMCRDGIFYVIDFPRVMNQAC
jgi:L-amino acid N-acyltransferase YncA